MTPPSYAFMYPLSHRLITYLLQFFYSPSSVPSARVPFAWLTSCWTVVCLRKLCHYWAAWAVRPHCKSLTPSHIGFAKQADMLACIICIDGSGSALLVDDLLCSLLPFNTPAPFDNALTDTRSIWSRVYLGLANRLHNAAAAAGCSIVGLTMRKFSQ